MNVYENFWNGKNTYPQIFIEIFHLHPILNLRVERIYYSFAVLLKIIILPNSMREMLFVTNFNDVKRF